MPKVALPEISLQPGKRGVLIPVRVKPQGKNSEIEGVRDGVLLITVRAAPIDGAANAAVIEVLAKALGCARSTLEVVRGHKSREKMIGVTQFSPEEIALRLTTLLNDE